MLDNWYVYRHVNGTLHLKKMFVEEDLLELYQSDFVERVWGPFTDRPEAVAKVTEMQNKVSEPERLTVIRSIEILAGSLRNLEDSFSLRVAVAEVAVKLQGLLDRHENDNG